MPARLHSTRFRAVFVAMALVVALGVAGFTAVTANAATATRCYVSGNQIVGPGSVGAFSAQITNSANVPIAGVKAQLERYVSGVWQAYYYKLTDANGRARLTVAPNVTMTMRLTLRATATYVGCATGARTMWISSDPAVIAEAARHNGQPYVYGAAGPSSFDCSGFTQYVFRQFGRLLPRTTSQQYAAVRHISQSARVSGDLIFFGSSTGGIYHMGIYAGGGYIWHAPTSGQTVRKQLIWTSAYYVGRL